VKLRMCKGARRAKAQLLRDWEADRRGGKVPAYNAHGGADWRGQLFDHLTRWFELQGDTPCLGGREVWELALAASTVSSERALGDMVPALCSAAVRQRDEGFGYGTRLERAFGWGVDSIKLLVMLYNELAWSGTEGEGDSSDEAVKAIRQLDEYPKRALGWGVMTYGTWTWDYELAYCESSWAWAARDLLAILTGLKCWREELQTIREVDRRGRRRADGSYLVSGEADAVKAEKAGALGGDSFEVVRRRIGDLCRLMLVEQVSLYGDYEKSGQRGSRISEQAQTVRRRTRWGKPEMLIALGLDGSAGFRGLTWLRWQHGGRRMVDAVIRAIRELTGSDDVAGILRWFVESYAEGQNCGLI
jgi:hypothetical protein